MDNKNLLKCCKAVLDFLNEEFHETVKRNTMSKLLVENGWYKNEEIESKKYSSLSIFSRVLQVRWYQNNNFFYPDIIGFTEYLNERFELDYKVIDKYFFENYSKDFYKIIIRDLTINEIINEMG